MSFEEVISNPIRQSIIIECSKKPCSIVELEKNFKINRGSIKHHIFILQEVKLVSVEHNKKASGKPAEIKAPKESVNKIQAYYKKQESKLERA